MEEMRDKSQIFSRKIIKFSNILYLVFLFSLLDYLKIVIADTIGIYVDEWFVNLADLNFMKVGSQLLVLQSKFILIFRLH